VGVDLHLQGPVLHCFFLPPQVVLLQKCLDHMVVEIIEDVAVLLGTLSGKVGIGDLIQLTHDVGEEFPLLAVGAVGQVQSKQQRDERQGDGVVHQGGREPVEQGLVHSQGVFPAVLAGGRLKVLHVLSCILKRRIGE